MGRATDKRAASTRRPASATRAASTGHSRSPRGRSARSSLAPHGAARVVVASDWAPIRAFDPIIRADLEGQGPGAGGGVVEDQGRARADGFEELGVAQTADGAAGRQQPVGMQAQQ